MSQGKSLLKSLDEVRTAVRTEDDVDKTAREVPKLILWFKMGTRWERRENERVWTSTWNQICFAYVCCLLGLTPAAFVAKHWNFYTFFQTTQIFLQLRRLTFFSKKLEFAVLRMTHVVELAAAVYCSSCQWLKEWSGSLQINPNRSKSSTNQFSFRINRD